MIVCLCHGISERSLDDCIDAGATTVDDVGLMSGAGMGCGACRCTIQDRLACTGYAQRSEPHAPGRASLALYTEARTAA